MSTTFAYKVRDRSGKLVEGQLEADDRTLVVDKLRSMGYTPIAIEEQKSGALDKEFQLPWAKRIPLKDVAVFSRQFATMINSGLTLLRALAILAAQTENQALAQVCNQVRLDVERGSSLSAAFARHPKVFNRLYIAMVRSGEIGGVLDSVLLRLASTIEKQLELRRKVRSAMTYPAVVGVLVVSIVSAMLIFIVPMFEDMYAELGGELPFLTQMLLNISSAIRKFFLFFVGSTILGAWGFRRWVASEQGRRAWDAVKLRVPVFGKLVQKVALARFSRTLAALIRSGVPILEALEIVADTSGNEVVSRAVHDAQAGVKQGEPIGRRLEDHAVFPPMVVQMIVVGEETGAIDEMLDKIADFYDQEVEATVAALTSLIEPLLIVVMGAAVGGMIVALYLPMFNIINLIQ